MIHAHFDPDTELLRAFFDDDIHSDIPWPSIAVTPAQRDEVVAAGGVWRVSPDALTLAREQDPVEDIASIRAGGARAVRALASARRAEIADADAVSIAGWPTKGARARRVLAGAGTPEDQRLLEAEAAARGRGETAAALAQNQAAQADFFETISVLVDGSEAAAAAAVAAALTREDVDAAVAALDAAISAHLASMQGA